MNRKAVQASVSKESISSSDRVRRGLREGALLIFGALAVYLFISLFSYQNSDPAWSHSTFSNEIKNAGGRVGAWFADVFLFLFGYLAFLFPLLVAGAGWYLFRGAKREVHETKVPVTLIRGIGFLLTLFAGTGLAALHFAQGRDSVLPADSGGLLGDLTSRGLVSVFNEFGASLFMITLVLTGFTLATGISWLRLMDGIGQFVMSSLSGLRVKVQDAKAAKESIQKRKILVATETEKAKNRSAPTIATVPPAPSIPSARVQKEKQLTLFDAPSDVSLPSLSLLDLPEPHSRKMSQAALEAMARQVELKLRDFNIEVEVVSVFPGPVITRFELQPAPGIKGSQISNLSKDLARSLSVISVRVVDVIPGKSVIGLEIPNENRELVRLIEILRSKECEQAGYPLVLALGKDIGGVPVIVDLAKMPHLLVAGTTGSGKSVAINAMVLSLLYNATPQQVRMIMVDPKMLELSVYDGIPHLLAPVVTDMKEAANALTWCVAEMERRYRLMAALGVRNIAGYNRKVKEAADSGSPILDPFHDAESESEAEPLTALPYIVVIVDELADMMMVVGKKVEQLIARLAQKARASGVHLILATQRPSVDVLTGLIKANIPTRIAFQVSSRVDSRTIIDQMGAEQLLGHGDMLFLAPGTGLPMRVHGAFVDDHEVHKVVADLKKRGEPNYNEEILNGGYAQDGSGGFMGAEDGDAETDPLYDEAVEIVTESRRASISGIQRRLKIGYNRAARMVEAMEQAGVVGPAQSNGQREVIAPRPPR